MQQELKKLGWFFTENEERKIYQISAKHPAWGHTKTFVATKLEDKTAVARAQEDCFRECQSRVKE